MYIPPLTHTLTDFHLEDDDDDDDLQSKRNSEAWQESWLQRFAVLTVEY